MAEIADFIAAFNQPCVDSSSPPMSPFRSRISVKQAYIGGRNDEHGAPPGCGPPSSNPHSLHARAKKIEVRDHASLQLRYRRRTLPRRDPQEEAGWLCLSAIWHRGRSGSLRDRGAAGGFAERCLSASRGSALRPERYPYPVRERSLPA